MNYTSAQEIYTIFRKHPYISTDSRLVQAGSLFFALKGEHFDGNLYTDKALENGAVYAVIDNPEYYREERTLLVKNVLSALQDVASLHRNSLHIPIIGITGTNGKTTTKELLATALSVRFNTLATRGNLNNHIGVPLTLLSITPETEIAVIEMGANHIGEIEALCRIARPTHGLITNIGKAHLEGFGSPEGVITAKNELYQHLLHDGGTGFVNKDNLLLMRLSSHMNKVLYGRNPPADYQGNDSLVNGRLKVQLQHPVKTKILTQLTGKYNFENVMAAMSVAGHFKVDLMEAAAALSEYEPRMNRSQIIESQNNTIILDAYNANPSSMELAIRNFAEFEKMPKAIILGDMFELGEAAPTEHTQMLKTARQYNFSQIITAGPHFMQAATNFIGIRSFPDALSLKEFLVQHPLHHHIILVKGSRGMKLETLTDVL
ncbi:MAG: UDP-N-acetylmuramoyl-tripeptide--D-alanyl-D-alanine ligase [Lentimicrobium sp.]|jgi:UDP-N-acetylmuramoyl-tripeptide--D-alanyl-D-alanine ligase|nr:UDP-N-acetylmuramoyl-tripeptide--D-alanyl-D-alanine ligase [Lentimicrobium sp.]